MTRPNGCKPVVTCQNSERPFYLLGNGKHVVKKGFSCAGRQIYLCGYCSTYFVETMNTPLCHKRMSRDDIELIGKLANERMCVRAIERVTGHHRDMVSRILRELAGHAEYVEGLVVPVGSTGLRLR